MKDLFQNVKAFYMGNETRIIASILFAVLFVALLLCIVGCTPGKTTVKASGNHEKIKATVSYEIVEY